ncbi:nucleoside recognition domain-containing protein [Paenibacillus sp. 481]|uniref:nucleoside recognition domain-containing protein n=1 Tax=Paenibacillus sp. 481 TaxID=2835869 RepID=UPI001E4F2039|nr:nucleoside recognition domain-containing protein [Paenibacillus sp. 481]UHA73988.1 nucleoside recognition domain-containing protein [Paenibacillus sp. 481]
MFSFRTPFSQHPFFTLIFGCMAALLVVCIVSYPDQAFNASLQGLKIWWNIIFPALLPFLVLSEMLIAYGWVHGLGVLLDPLMRLLFRLPGVGGWAWSIGWTAGYPAGAEAVVKLRHQEALSRREAERLLSLSHANNPIFMIAVIGVGFMQQAELGLVIAIVHWISALLSIFVLRLCDKSAPDITTYRLATEHATSMKPKSSSSLLQRVLEAMEHAHRRDGRPFGKLLGESVTSAVHTLMMIGGYMMMFSVIAQVLRLAIPQQFGNYMMNGLLEVNLGAYTLGSATFTSPIFQAALIGAVVAWSGISAHLQIHSIIKGTDIRYRTFMLSRLLHAGMAFVLTYVLWRPLRSIFHHEDEAAAVFAATGPIEEAGASSASVHDQAANSLSSPEGALEWIHVSEWYVLMPLCVLFVASLFIVSRIIALFARSR